MISVVIRSNKKCNRFKGNKVVVRLDGMEQRMWKGSSEGGHFLCMLLFSVVVAAAAELMTARDPISSGSSSIRREEGNDAAVVGLRN